MPKKEIYPTAYADETMHVLERCGCLLVSGDMKKANVMTIGWGLIGRIWGKPVFIIAVRPSRYTHGFIERTGDFTVNVPKKGMEDAVAYCGKVSGREHDKFKEAKLTLQHAKKVKSPIISECIVHYECKVIYKTKLVVEGLSKHMVGEWYKKGDFHTIYFGEILATYVDDVVSK